VCILNNNELLTIQRNLKKMVKQINTKSTGFGTRIAQSRHAKDRSPWRARVPRPAAHGLAWAIPVPNPHSFSILCLR